MLFGHRLNLKRTEILQNYIFNHIIIFNYYFNNSRHEYFKCPKCIVLVSRDF